MGVADDPYYLKRYAVPLLHSPEKDAINGVVHLLDTDDAHLQGALPIFPALSRSSPFVNGKHGVVGSRVGAGNENRAVVGKQAHALARLERLSCVVLLPSYATRNTPF